MGYVDTSNIAKGIRPIDVEYYTKHKDEFDKTYSWLQVCIKPLWDKWQNGGLQGIEIGYNNREWLINPKSPLGLGVSNDGH